MLFPKSIPTSPSPSPPRPWPAALPAQAAALRDLLATLEQPAAVAAIAAAFVGKATPKRQADIQRLLETMAALGQAERTAEGRWKR